VCRQNRRCAAAETCEPPPDAPAHTGPQVAFYHKLGLSKQDMCRLAEGRTQLFHLALPTIESKLKFLREEAGITDPADMRKLLIKCPRIVEYKTERTLRPRLDFLKRHNIQDSDIPKVRQPCLRRRLSCSTACDVQRCPHAT